MNFPAVWALTDNRPGNRTQVLGTAEALGWLYKEVNIHASSFARLPNLLLGKSLLGWKNKNEYSLASDALPNLILSAGRRSAPIALALKRRALAAGKRCIACHLMRPEIGYRDFDLIVLPTHDPDTKHHNVMRVWGAAHQITPSKLEQARQDFQPLFSALPAPRIACLVGGASRKQTFTHFDAARLGTRLHALMAAGGGSLLLTTSRRTGAEQTQALLSPLQDTTGYFHTWGDARPNPYLGFLAWADALIVTEDSVSMLCEATATGKPVHLYNLGRRSPFTTFHQAFLQHGLTRPFNDRLENWSYVPYSAAEKIAAEITRRFFDNTLHTGQQPPHWTHSGF